MDNTKSGFQRLEAAEALAVDDEPAYLTEFRQAMLARGLATRTRNAYVRDLRSCELTHHKALTQWQADEVRVIRKKERISDNANKYETAIDRSERICSV